MQRREMQNYTPEQVAGHLDDALAIIDATDIPNDLRPAAFVKVLELVAAKQVVLVQPQAGAVDLSIAALRANHTD
jgi:hypothetical protein